MLINWHFWQIRLNRFNFVTGLAKGIDKNKPKEFEGKMKQKINKPLLFLIGLFLLISGVTLILSWWPALIVFLKGIIGIILALSGMGVLYTIKKL